MQTIDTLLDQVKAKHGIKSDYKLAPFLGVTQNTVANWRHARSRPDDNTLARMADLAGVDPITVEVLAVQFQAERSQSEDVRKMWQSIARRLQTGGAAAGFLAALGVSLLVSASPRAEASPLPFDQVKAAARGGLCVMSNGIRKAKTLLSRALGALGTFAGPLIGSRHVQSATPDSAHLHAA